MMDIAVLANVIFIDIFVILSAICEPSCFLLTLYTIEKSNLYICMGASLESTNFV